MNIFESSQAPLGPRATENTHRKIELQSPADLTHLIGNASRAARERLDTHFPPGAIVENDRMRARVEELVAAYIQDTFAVARENLCINGMDAREFEEELARAQEGEEFEAFDSKLAQRVQTLSAQIERQTLALANLRRSAPAASAKRFNEAFVAQSAADDERLRRESDERLARAKSVALDVGEMPRLEEMERNWMKSREELEVLKTGLGEAVGRMEKARRAVNYVSGEA